MQKHTAVALAQTGVIVVALLWFVSVMVDCEHYLAKSCDQAIYRSWLDLWRLKWVANYKEIVAGSIAALAGWSAIYAVRLQINANRRTEIERTSQQVRAALSMISADFDRALMTFSRTATEKSADLKLTLAALPVVSQADPTFARILATTSHAVELGLIEAVTEGRNYVAEKIRREPADWTWRPDTSEPVDEQTLRDGWVHAAAMSFFLADGGARVRQDGSIALEPVSADRYQSFARREGIDDESLPLRELFVWR